MKENGERISVPLETLGQSLVEGLIALNNRYYEQYEPTDTTEDEHNENLRGMGDAYGDAGSTINKALEKLRTSVEYWTERQKKES